MINYMSCFQEPLMIERCVITVDPDYDKVFEVHEQGRETYLFKVPVQKHGIIYMYHL